MRPIELENGIIMNVFDKLIARVLGKMDNNRRANIISKAMNGEPLLMNFAILTKKDTHPDERGIFYQKNGPKKPLSYYEDKYFLVPVNAISD